MSLPRYLRKIVNPNDQTYGRPLTAPVPGAPNFAYGELIASDTAARLGIMNIPTEEHWQALEYLAVHVLQPIRDISGEPMRLSSAYRSAALNQAVGGSSRSHHSHGRAADIDPFSCGNDVLLNILNIAAFADKPDGSGKIPCWEIIMEDCPTGWVHVAHNHGQLRGHEQTMKIMLKRKQCNELPIFDMNSGQAIDIHRDPKAAKVYKRLGIALPATYEEILAYMAGDLRALDQAILRAYYAQ